MAGHGGSTKAIAAAFAANTGIAIAKFVGFLVTGSSALLAESIHSVADASNQGLLVLGGRRARRRPSALHPFGYGRVRYFWSFVVAVVLFSLGGLFSLYEGAMKITDPHEISSPAVAFSILGVAIVFEATGIALALVTGNPLFDGLGTLAIGLLLLAIAIVLALEMKSLLIGESAAPETIERIEAEITQGREVSPRDPHAHAAPRPGRPPRGGEGGVRSRPLDARARGRDQRLRGASARRGADRAPDLPGTRSLESGLRAGVGCSLSRSTSPKEEP